MLHAARQTLCIHFTLCQLDCSSNTYSNRTREEAKRNNVWVPARRCIVGHSFVALLVGVVAVQILVVVVDLVMVAATLEQDKR